MNEEILADFQKYTDSFGLLQNKPTPGPGASGNGVLYSSEAVLVFRKYNISPEKYLHAIHSCAVTYGLLKRAPNNSDYESFDDYVGVACVTRWWAWDILEYGKTHRWLFNNVDQGKWRAASWFGRMPHFIAHIYYASKKKPPLWTRPFWIANILLAAGQPIQNQDAWILSRLMLIARDKDDWVSRYWNKKFNEVCGGDIRKIYAAYFGDNNHPLAKWA